MFLFTYDRHIFGYFNHNRFKELNPLFINISAQMIGTSSALIVVSPAFLKKFTQQFPHD